MKDMTTVEIIDSIRDWSLDQIEDVEDAGDKIALFEEFKEWIEPKEEDIDILSLDQQEQDCQTNNLGSVAQMDRAIHF